jgi:ABC-type nitrate/sulfonate/bicarbonate transport systems, periplasmic components
MLSTRRLRHAAAGLGALLLGALTLTACSGSQPSGPPVGEDGTVELVIAEPVHGVGYLPLYVGIQKGYFEEEGLNVSTVTLQGGGAHTNAVLTGQAWGFIGGPEHNAFAQAKGASIKAIANIVNRGNVYLVAPPGVTFDGDLAGLLAGKTIATGAYGSTPNSITRYLVEQAGLEVGGDVTLIESAEANASLAIVGSGQADLAVTSEPILGQGIDEGIWGEPIYNVPQELGPYAFSTINIRTESIENDPETVAAFTRGLVRALEFTDQNREEAFEIAKKEFPTFDPDVLKATLDRAYADGLWEFTGQITPESIDTALAVVRASGVLKDADDPVTYDEIVDMTFIEQVGSE